MKLLPPFIIPCLLWAQHAIPAQAQAVPPPMSIPPVEPAPANWQELGAEQRLSDLKHRRAASLQNQLHAHGFRLGNAAFLRVIKESSELELWLRDEDHATAFELFKTWKIAFYSGTLGPKTREGDNQAPEGLYSVTPRRMNPLSKYHLSFNIGYPNAFDLAQHRTGGLIMIHGKNVSIGCYAMTDPVIEDLYLIIDAALHAGQKEVPVHCYPFRMSPERLAQARAGNSPWTSFWEELAPAWQAFEQSHLPPSWGVRDGHYAIHP